MKMEEAKNTVAKYLMQEFENTNIEERGKRNRTDESQVDSMQDLDLLDD